MKDIITQFAEQESNSLQPTYSTGKQEVSSFSTNKELVSQIITIINVIIGILGLVAVVVIIYGGVQYMTSTGESSKVKKAKDTILYGVIGLIICILAFAIVNFIIANIANV